MIRAIIVDNEPGSRDVLLTLLEKYCPEIKIEGVGPSEKEAIAVLSKQSIQLIFPDIDMRHMNWLELLERLQKIHQPPARINRIALPTMEGLQLIPIESIISCSSNSNYTMLSLKDEQKIVVSRTLKEIEEMLGEYGFFRVHHSHLVNLNEIRKYIKGEGGSLVMSNGSTVDVSRSKKEGLLRKLQPPR